jgi:putative phage-type endonuclease
MQVEELEQNSLEWHEHRAKYRNASEAGSVMGCNPFQTKRELWESRNGLGKPFVGNVATEYGHKMEPIALAKLSSMLEIEFKSAVFVEGEYSASLDAYGTLADGKTVKVEIKCPYQREDSKLWKSVQNSEIPKHYYWQMVHQNICCPTDHSYFFVYINDDTYNFRDTEWFLEQGDEQSLMAAWDGFMANEPAPAFAPRPDLAEIGQLYKDLKAKSDEIAGELKAVEATLKDACEESSEAGPIKVQIISKKGNIDYSKVPEIKGIDLDDYRKKSTTYKKITVGK